MPLFRRFCCLTDRESRKMSSNLPEPTLDREVCPMKVFQQREERKVRTPITKDGSVVGPVTLLSASWPFDPDFLPCPALHRSHTTMPIHRNAGSDQPSPFHLSLPCFRSSVSSPWSRNRDIQNPQHDHQELSRNLKKGDGTRKPSSSCPLSAQVGRNGLNTGGTPRDPYALQVASRILYSIP